MILYELFKVLDPITTRKCTVIIQNSNKDDVILKDIDLTYVDNKAMYYLVDRIVINANYLTIYTIEK